MAWLVWADDEGPGQQLGGLAKHPIQLEITGMQGRGMEPTLQPYAQCIMHDNQQLGIPVLNRSLAI